MYQYVFKRLIDIIVSLLVFPFFLIIFILVFIAIKIEDKGPVFYIAPRLGKDMKEFPMYKFRTMIVNAPDYRNEDGTTYNAEDDPRVTKVGKFLRKTSIDEIPQIINVLKGDMSLVGPRPSPLGNIDIYPKTYLDKFKVKPGITGYNQVLLRNKSTMEQRIQNDLFYINNLSFKLDLKILIMTVFTVFKSKNIYRN